jgi:predicted Ser/Thr protein kinase
MHEDIETKHCQDILRKNNLYVIKKLGKGAFGIVYLVSRANLKANEA